MIRAALAWSAGALGGAFLGGIAMGVILWIKPRAAPPPIVACGADTVAPWPVRTGPGYLDPRHFACDRRPHRDGPHHGVAADGAELTWGDAPP